jgi:hypothetical protein
MTRPSSNRIAKSAASVIGSRSRFIALLRAAEVPEDVITSDDYVILQHLIEQYAAVFARERGVLVRGSVQVRAPAFAAQAEAEAEAESEAESEADEADAAAPE